MASPVLKEREEKQAWIDWLQTWAWTPLNGRYQEQRNGAYGYYALSYVWSDQQSIPDLSEDDLSRIKFFQAGEQSYMEAKKSARPKWALGIGGNVTFSKVPIVVNGTLVEVGRNLEKALRSLRDIPEIQHGRRVWVDSLCINQQDPLEKSIEVMRMGDIFKTAERVVSWIGEEENDSSDALEAMNVAGRLNSITKDEAKQLSEWFYGEGGSSIRCSIDQLMSRAYWTRVWITQEVAMRDSGAVILCGSRCFPTANILRFGTHMVRCAPALNVDGSASSDKTYGSIGNYILARSLKKKASKLRDFDALNACDLSVRSHTNAALWFRVASASFATDPRDNLYGMLNVLPPEIASRITVDYMTSNTYQNVMTNLAVAHMASTRSMTWLRYRPWLPFHGQDEWPSWVPNLGMHFNSTHFDWVTGEFDCNLGLEAQRYQEPAIGYDQYDKPTLNVDGYFIDTISANTTNIINHRNIERSQSIGNALSSHGVGEVPAVQAFMKRELNQLRERIAFLDPPALSNLSLSHSPDHNYTDRSGVREALGQCFSRIMFHVQHDSDSKFDVPLDYLEHRVQSLDQGTLLDQSTAALMPSALPVLKDLLLRSGTSIFGARV